MTILKGQRHVHQRYERSLTSEILPIDRLQVKVLVSQLMVVVGGAREEGAAAGSHDTRSSLLYDRSRFMYEMKKKLALRA